MKESGKKPIIVTKIGPFNHSSPEALRADVLAQGRQYLKDLQVSQIDIIMLHNTDAGMAIFARSVFLQGIVFMKPDELDDDMKFCAPYIQKFRDLADEFGLEPPVLALSFVLSLPAITTVVLGCQTPEQIESNCEMMDKIVKLTDAQKEKIHEAFKNIERKVINPALWHN